MTLLSFTETPFQVELSFNHAIEKLEKLAADPSGEGSVAARSLLEEILPFPELRTGITDESQIKKNSGLIRRLLADYFPADLTKNEIKAVNMPYTGIIFNHTERFRKILDAAGPDFDINIRDFDEHQFYVLSCCIILNEFYGTHLDFAKPLFYDIPTAEGITKHYRILNNADFLEILPTERSVKLSQEDIHQLMDNYDNISLWKEKFPKESWKVKGFSIMTLFDATVENAVSILKEKLLGLNVTGFQQSMESIFRSIYRIPDIKVGFTVFNQENGKLSMDAFGRQKQSFILKDENHKDARELLCLNVYRKVVDEKVYFAVSDTSEFQLANPESNLTKRLLAQNIQSFILAPVVKNDVLLGILEVVSLRPGELNSINANKLGVVMPFLTNTVERLISQLQNQVQAIIQEKYTTIHPSVYWKFRAEAQSQIHHRQIGKEYIMKEILFPDVYPLYGQVDIKGSSETRNAGVRKDLTKQITELISLLKKLDLKKLVGPIHREELQLNIFLDELSSPLKADTEQYISNYLVNRIHVRLQGISDPTVLPVINKYLAETDKGKGSFHIHRRKYETTISIINEKMSSVIDSRQSAAQVLFPHYYERYKTDGVEHNLYIGPSISPGHEFNVEKLHWLRLWQLRVLCEMETVHHHLKPALPYPLEVTTLVLVYNSTIAIRFRMDEKRFDVDGSYNARFEIVKKRIDKAHIKNTPDRITQSGKLTIVYSSDVEECEYRRYIETLQSERLLGNEIEQFEVEELKGISGLKGLRVKIVHQEVLA